MVFYGNENEQTQALATTLMKPDIKELFAYNSIHINKTEL